MDDMDKRVARFGAMLVLEHWLANVSSGFLTPEGIKLDTYARECGLMGGGYDPAPGLADAARRLVEPPPTDARVLEDLRRKFVDMARALGLDVRLGGEVE